MGRLEEIRERLDAALHKRGMDGYNARNCFQTNAEADVEFLLERLQIAERELERILETIKEREIERVFVNPKMEYSLEIRLIAEEALEQIRRD